MSEHTVQNKQRCMSTLNKLIISHIYFEDAIDINQKLMAFDHFESKCQQQGLQNHEEIAVIYLILSLSKKRRTKTNFETILLKGKRQFQLLLSKLGINIPNIKEEELKYAQLNVRARICKDYLQNSAHYWKIYEKQTQDNKENLKKLHKIMDKIYLEDGLQWEVKIQGQNKSKRMNLKKKLAEPQSSEESLVATGVQSEQLFQLMTPQDIWKSSSQNYQLHLIEQGPTLLLYSSYRTCCLGRSNSLDSCPLCQEFKRLDGLLCPYQDK